jgi:hypothetical protein
VTLVREPYTIHDVFSNRTCRFRRALNTVAERKQRRIYRIAKGGARIVMETFSERLLVSLHRKDSTDDKSRSEESGQRGRRVLAGPLKKTGARAFNLFSGRVHGLAGLLAYQLHFLVGHVAGFLQLFASGFNASGGFGRGLIGR